MPEDGLGEITGAAIVQVTDVGAVAHDLVGVTNAPQRRGTPHAAFGLALDKLVGKVCAHVMQQQVGVGVDRLVTQLGKQVAWSSFHRHCVAGRASHALEDLGAGTHLHRIDAVFIQRRHALGETAGNTALGRHAHQRKIVGDRLQIGLQDALLGWGGSAAGRVGVAGKIGVDGRSHRHVQQQRGSGLLTQRGLGRLPAEATQADGSRLGIKDEVR